MSHAPFSSLSSSAPASSAGGPVVETVHACARHTEMRGDRGCLGCSNALCTACARSLRHRHCPECRQKAGKAAHFVDTSWRVALLVDALSSSWKAIPRRAPALLAVLGLALVVPLAIYGLADPQSSDWSDGIALAAGFGFGAFFLGAFLQPLLVLPTLAQTSTLRALGGALLGCLAAFLPLLAVGVVVGVLDGALHHALSDLLGFVFIAVAAVSLPLGLTWQGRAVLGRGPSLRGTLGGVVAHFCVAGAWGFALSFAWIPVAVAVGVGAVIHPAVAGVVGVVCGLVIWLGVLLGMGSFAAASARYSDDLQRLR
jgi:hypothetical protein